jgi:hypothetical protein
LPIDRPDLLAKWHELLRKQPAEPFWERVEEFGNVGRAKRRAQGVTTDRRSSHRDVADRDAADGNRANCNATKRQKADGYPTQRAQPESQRSDRHDPNRDAAYRDATYRDPSQCDHACREVADGDYSSGVAS